MGMADELRKRARHSRSRLEALLAMGSSAIAEPAAGLAGIAGLLTGGLDRGVRNIEATRGALTYQPRDPQGMQELGEAIAPIVEPIERAKRYMGDGVLEATGSPAAATAAYVAPEALAALLGARGAGMRGPTMQQMAERSAGPGMGSPAGQVGAIGAWHGSPHDFDRFDMSKLGTGEGAQAYGHGLYFAGRPEVAGQYQKSLSGRVGIGAPRASDQAHVAAARSFREAGYSREDALEGMRSAYRGISDKDFDLAWHESNPGRLYKTELAPDEDDLLDWDAPLSEQPEKVRKAVESLGRVPNRSGQNLLEMDPIGEALYRALGGPETASEALRELGIPGIRYLDGQSRGAGEGSRNYVIFDDSLVKILGKE